MAELEIRWTINAEEDILGIVNWIKEHSGPMTAGNIYNRIKSRVLPLADFPGTGRSVPQLVQLGITDIKQILEKPWIIYYKVSNNIIWILAVIDGRRNLEDIVYKKVVEGKRV
jgi:toxin ParE1/3/4